MARPTLHVIGTPTQYFNKQTGNSGLTCAKLSQVKEADGDFSQDSGTIVDLPILDHR